MHIEKSGARKPLVAASSRGIGYVNLEGKHGMTLSAMNAMGDIFTVTISFAELDALNEKRTKYKDEWGTE